MNCICWPFKRSQQRVNEEIIPVTLSTPQKTSSKDDSNTNDERMIQFDNLDLPLKNTLPPESKVMTTLRNHEIINKLVFPNVDKIYRFDLLDFKEESIIGASSRHLIKEYIHLPTEKLVAIKFLNIPLSQYDSENNMSMFMQLLREMANFNMLINCPEVVNCYGVGLLELEPQICICMELMDISLKDLYIIIHKKERIFPEELIGYIVVRITDAINYCKSIGIMHRDIKPSNILCCKKGFIKLCDFGESRILGNSLASTHIGTAAYWAPERFTFKYDFRADIWSFGITLLEAIFGRLPTTDMTFDQISLFSSILNFDYHEMIESSLKNDYSQDLNDFLSKCVAKIENRFTQSEILDNVFYQRYKDSTNNQIAETFMRYQVFTDYSTSDKLRESTNSFLPPELYLPEPDNISFVDSLYNEIPQHLEHALKRHHCKLIFPDGTYDFHKIRYVDFR